MGIIAPEQELISGRWNLYLLSDYSVRFYLSQETVVNFENDAYELKNHYNTKGQLRSRPMDVYNVFNKAGLSWSKRTNKFKPHYVSLGI